MEKNILKQVILCMYASLLVDNEERKRKSKLFRTPGDSDNFIINSQVTNNIRHDIFLLYLTSSDDTFSVHKEKERNAHMELYK